MTSDNDGLINALLTVKFVKELSQARLAELLPIIFTKPDVVHYVNSDTVLCQALLAAGEAYGVDCILAGYNQAAMESKNEKKKNRKKQKEQENNAKREEENESEEEEEMRESKYEVVAVEHVLSTLNSSPNLAHAFIRQASVNQLAGTNLLEALLKGDTSVAKATENPISATTDTI